MAADGSEPSEETDQTKADQTVPSPTATGTTGVDTEADEGPGCMPAILAASILMGIAGCIFCGVMGWLIFQKQGELALRSMRGSFIPAVEQSLLAPEEKRATVELLNEFADDLERGKLEGWQASGVMQRIQRLPVLQWGQIRRLELFVQEHPDDFAEDDGIQFSRLRHGVEQNKVTTIDFTHILSPVLQRDSGSEQARLINELRVDAVADSVARARLVADRLDIEPKVGSDIGIDVMVRRQIEAGIEKGTY